MSNGYYTSPTINWPAPRNKGGYNAQQLSLQKNIQDNVRSFNTKIRDAKTFANAPKFSDHVKEFWGAKINEYSEAQNGYVSGDISATDQKKSQEDLETLWSQWKNVAPYIAALGEEVHQYGIAGELDKLNDPNLEALLSHMQRNDGSVTLQSEGNKLYLTGLGEIDEKNTNGESTGNKLPWEYDLDIEAFLQIIGFNTYEQDPTGTGKIDGAIFDNLNKIISRRATEESMDLESTIKAAVTQSSVKYKVPTKDRNNKDTGTEELSFVLENALRYNLNYGGMPSNSGAVDMGSTKWVGTDDSPSIMNASNFDSYYANVLYKDYQPHYNEESEIDWLIDYDDNGNVEDRVKPWNLADEGIWVPTRDRLTSDALKNQNAVNQGMMLTLKDEYKLILDSDYNGDMRKFQTDRDESGELKYQISGDPFEYYKGTTDHAQRKWTEAETYNKPEGTVIEPEAETIINGSTQARAQAIASMVKENSYPRFLAGGGSNMADYFNALEMTDEETGGTYTVSDYLSGLPLELKGKLNDYKGQISLEVNDENRDQMFLKIMDRTLPKELRDRLKNQGWVWEGEDQAGPGNDKYWAKPFDLRVNKDEGKLWQLIIAELKKVGAKVQAKR